MTGQRIQATESVSTLQGSSGSLVLFPVLVDSVDEVSSEVVSSVVSDSSSSSA